MDTTFYRLLVKNLFDGVYFTENDAAEELISRADSLMYKSKTAGETALLRNKITQ